MAKFKVYVTEYVRVEYPFVIVEAGSEEEAQDIGEDMRAEGVLGDPHLNEVVEDVSVDVAEVPA